MNSMHPIFQQALAPFTTGLEDVNEAHEATQKTIRERNAALATLAPSAVGAREPAGAEPHSALPHSAPAQYTGNQIFALNAVVDNVLDLSRRARLDMRELSPDAPRATSQQDRCPHHSYLRPTCRCILQAGHAKLGFVYCQFRLAEIPRTCMACIPTNAIGEEGFECGKPAVGDSEMCAEHLEGSL